MGSYHKREYRRSSEICLACIAQARGTGVIRLDLELATGLSKSTLSHVLQILVNQRKVAHTPASAVGEKCVNRRRYYAADWAPRGSRFGQEAVNLVVPQGFTDVVFAPSARSPTGWPPRFRPQYVPDKRPTAMPADVAAVRRANSGFERVPLGLQGGAEFLRMTSAAA